MDVYTIMLTTFFIDVSTWHGRQKAMEDFFFRFYAKDVCSSLESLDLPLSCNVNCSYKKNLLSKLGVLLNFSFVSLHDLLCAIGDGFSRS